MTVESLSLHFLKQYPKDAARVLERFESEQLADYCNRQPPSVLAKIFRYMTPAKVVSCLVLMDIDNAAKVFEDFSIERSSTLLRRLQPDIRLKIIRAMSTLYSNMIKVVIRFPDDTVGRYISPNIFTVLDTMYVKDIISTFKDSVDQVRSEIFVVNEKQRLAGMVYVRDLLVTDTNLPVRKIMRVAPQSISARSRLINVQNNSEWKYNEMLPVIDTNGLFIGVLKRGVMLDVISRSIDSSQQEDGFATTAMAMADLFWNTCTELLLPEVDQKNPESKDGTNKQ